MICQVVTYGRLKTKENFKLLALEVVAVDYERWSLTRGSKYSDLTGKFLVFWNTWSLRRGGRLREVVATGGSTVFTSAISGNGTFGIFLARISPNNCHGQTV